MSGLVLALALSATAAAPASSQAPATPPCLAGDAAHALDFWLGDWDVYAGGQLDGRDTVTRELNGCAVIEVWKDVGGGEGKSLFAFDARKQLWTQTWVTGDTSQPGGIKFKVLRKRAPGTTTFQGEIESKSGAVYYDRTTLTANPDGTVQQVIEVSRDGTDWKTGFDAIYRRRPAK